MKQLRELLSKYSGKKVQIVGINLDDDQAKARKYVRDGRISWTQWHEKGGLDSRLANELGVLTLPTMLLIDQKGRVVNRGIHMAELEKAISKLLP